MRKKCSRIFLDLPRRRCALRHFLNAIFFHHDNKKSAKSAQGRIFLSVVSDEIYSPAMNGANLDMCKYPNLKAYIKARREKNVFR
ncbi:MAG: hypothetical protein L6V93_09310 [Clostridiales bacterium]|nr:MAG: hypothetical protein L6V93_09310 [Clostridiales bacterium]